MSHTRKRRGVTDIVALWLQAGGRCGICREPLLPEAISIDHIVPLARGGDDGAANLQFAHRRCNNRKGTRLPNEPPAVPKMRPRMRTTALLSLDEVAHLLGVAPVVVQGWTRRGILHAQQFPGSGRLGVRLEELTRFKNELSGVTGG